MTTLSLPSYAQLSAADDDALIELYRRGTPPNTLRARERDLAYISAWKMASFGQPLVWPEEEKVALRFVLDHAQDLAEKPGPARDVAMGLIAIGLRVSLACPAPATLDRRIASWRAFHRMRNLSSPFAAPLVQQARQKARRANARPRIPKSQKPVTRDVLEQLLATCNATTRGIRDRAMLMLAFASGGRRRSEVTALNVEDIGLDDFAARGLVWITLLETKTTQKNQAPRLPIKGSAARALVHWLDVTELAQGPPLPSRLDIRSPPAPPHGLGCPTSDSAASVASGRSTGRLCDTTWIAGGVPDAGRAGRCAARCSNEAVPASFGDPGPDLLCGIEISENPATDLLD